MSRFEEFWVAWPDNGKDPFDEYTRKKNRKGCEKKWNERKFDAVAETIIMDVQRRAKFDKNWRSNRGSFIPLPITYLNQEQWNDGGFADVRDARKKPATATRAPETYDTGPPMSKYARYANLYLLKALLKIRGLRNDGLLATVVRQKNEVVRQAESDGQWTNEEFVDVISNTIDTALEVRDGA